MNAWLEVWHWQWEPQIVAAVAVLGWLFGRGIARMAATATSTTLLRLRVASFYAALLALVIALESPIDALSDTSFGWHMTQHMLLLLVAPPLAVAAAPWSPLRAGLPSRRLRYGPLPAPLTALRARFMVLPGRARVASHLGHPRAALLAFTGYLWLMHVPAVFDLALENQFVHDNEHLGYVIVGLWFWSRLISSPPLPALPSYRWRVELIGGGILACWALGIVLMLSSAHLYAPYLQVPGATPQGTLSSLQIGAAIMWAPSMVPFDVVLTVTVRRWLRQNGAGARPGPLVAEVAEVAAVAAPAGEGVS
jgi:cytochrome c oxidase assembly factor CtaG